MLKPARAGGNKIGISVGAVRETNIFRINGLRATSSLALCHSWSVPTNLTATAGLPSGTSKCWARAILIGMDRMGWKDGWHIAGVGLSVGRVTSYNEHSSGSSKQEVDASLVGLPLSAVEVID